MTTAGHASKRAGRRIFTASRRTEARMSEDAIAYASVLRLSRADINILGVKDAYALHKVVYGLFEDVRSDAEKQTSASSGIVYADKGGDFNMRQILMLSNRKPH